MNIQILKAVDFLIFFPFVMAVLMFCIKKASLLRNIVAGLGGFSIMITAILVGTKVLGTQGVTKNTFLTETAVYDHIIMGGEILLMCIVVFLSIKYKKYYAILLSMLGTLPVLWMDLTGQALEGSAHMRVDFLSAVMILIVGIVGILICIYACGYMKDYHNHHTEVEDRSNYFLALLFVFIGAMFGLIVSDNLGWIYFFWEITSVCSFLLIGYTRTEEAVNNSFRALWMNLLGGCGFAFGLMYCNMTLKVSNLSALTQLVPRENMLVMVPVTLFAFAALTKSAQFPFSRWLLGAMVAPTPSSALLHSATMVKIGVYMLIRLSPMLAGTFTGVMITVIGGFTFFAASLLAITVSDGKKVLAYSTISNLGLITACAGTGTTEGVWAATMLILFHAVSKSLLFQTVGDIENCMHSRDVEDMHGLIIKLPKLAFIMIIGICGMFMAPFGMLVSKWAALKSFVDSNSVWLVLFLVFGSGSTLFYWAKWLGKICTVIHQSYELEDITPRSEMISLFPLTTMIVVMCFAFPWMSDHMIQPILNEAFHKNIPNVIGGSDVIIMMIMVTMIFIIPIGSRFLAIGKKSKMTMSYVAGVNAGDDRHYIDSFGKERALYMSNWYMTDYFGEDKLLAPSIAISAVIVLVMLIIVIGGTI
ncbi:MULTISPECIES: NADH-quinone oxidoreductase subunit 5 family protein [unclassified Butyrivibrio]|uniref:NADH-quinone oxidoreductase subunit 5 family protein n=1 Tax=unclassified Butyrivibrio TaxID=2639466 RepID=UPI000400640D|nr:MULTISPECIES: proton-conducting transporter membrane subunit [unclassified Butyrivibrio]